MSGMLATGQVATGDYGSRTVTISVSGFCNQSISKTGNYQVRVPYGRMAQAMQNISRMGGKIEGVNVAGVEAAEASASEAPDPE
ncbi:MAG: phycobilisome linker polypeptide [Cyanobacteria bacterium P01_C01_bin.89]